MPELPEVETTVRGVQPFVTGVRITCVVVRQRQLRWPVPRGLTRTLSGHKVASVSRRANAANSSSATAIIFPSSSAGFSPSNVRMTKFPVRGFLQGGPFMHDRRFLDMLTSRKSRYEAQ